MLKCKLFPVFHDITKSFYWRYWRISDKGQISTDQVIPALGSVGCLAGCHHALDHLFTIIYTLWIIRKPIKRILDPMRLPGRPFWPAWTPEGPPSKSFEPLTMPFEPIGSLGSPVVPMGWSKCSPWHPCSLNQKSSQCQQEAHLFQNNDRIVHWMI